MSNSNTQRNVGIAVLLVLALVAAWWLFPSYDTQVSDPVVQAPPELAPEFIEALENQPKPPPSEPQVVIIDDDEGDIPRTTQCETIAGWAQRRVPHYTILDNIRDQAMKFTVDDLACLTAARDVPPIVLRFAEMYQRKDQE